MQFKNIFFSIVIIFTIFLSLIITPNNVLAHSSTCNSGSESTGWIVNCSSGSGGHAGTSYYTYNFASDLSNDYKLISNVGIGRWTSTSIVNIQYSLASSNLITSYGGPDSSVAAITSSWANASTGHKTKWQLSYNRYVMGNQTTEKNYVTAAHEIGHTIGLADLYNYSNIDKLMYVYTSTTASAPTSYDKTGANEAVK